MISRGGFVTSLDPTSSGLVISQPMFMARINLFSDTQLVARK